MRRYVIAGNWKMNMTPNGAKALIGEMKPLVEGKDNCDVVLCVPAIDIPAAVEAAKGSNIKIGAENVHFKASGAYTGEISAQMLVELDSRLAGHNPGFHQLDPFLQELQVVETAPLSWKFCTEVLVSK
jgi:triosephosphate isomerase